MPFSVPWTETPAEDFARQFVTHHWRMRSGFTAKDWSLYFAVYHDDELVGTQSVSTSSYLVTRTGETGSWLGMSFQGRGIGTLMRQAIIALMFDHLDAAQVTSGAFLDNPASLAVSRKLGYRPNGQVRHERRAGELAVNQHLVLTPENFVRPVGSLAGSGDSRFPRLRRSRLVRREIRPEFLDPGEHSAVEGSGVAAGFDDLPTGVGRTLPGLAVEDHGATGHGLRLECSNRNEFVTRYRDQGMFERFADVDQPERPLTSFAFGQPGREIRRRDRRSDGWCLHRLACRSTRGGPVVGALHAELRPAHRERVEHEQSAEKGIAQPADQLHRLGRHHRANNAADRAEDTGFRARGD